MVNPDQGRAKRTPPAEWTQTFDAYRVLAESSALNFPFKRVIPPGFYLKLCRHEQRQTAWSSMTSIDDGGAGGDPQVPFPSDRSSDAVRVTVSVTGDRHPKEAGVSTTAL